MRCALRVALVLAFVVPGGARGESFDGNTDVEVVPIVQPIVPGSSSSFSVTVKSIAGAVAGPIEAVASAWQMATGLSGPAPWTCPPGDGETFHCTHPGPLPAGGSLPPLVGTLITTVNGMAPPGDLPVSGALTSYCSIWPDTDICVRLDVDVVTPGSPATVLAHGFGGADLTQEVFRPDTQCTPNPAQVGDRVTCTTTPVNTETTSLGSSIGVRFYIPQDANPQSPSFSGTGWSCDFSGSTYWICTNPTGLAAGASGPPVTIEFDATQLTPFVFFGGSPIVDGFVGPGIGVGLEVLNSLAVLAVNGPPSTFPGDAATYVFTASNPTSNDFQDPLVVSADSPAGLVWTGFVDDPSGVWSCADNGGVIECTFFGTLIAQSVAPSFSLRFDVNGVATDCTTISGDCVHFTASMRDGNGVLASYAVETPLLPSGLTAAITTSTPLLAAGVDDEAQFTVDVTNVGTVDVYGVRVDVAPSALSLTNPTVIDDAGGIWACAPVPAVAYGAVMRCETSDFVAGGGGTLPPFTLGYVVTPGPFYPCVMPGSSGPRCARGELAALEALDTHTLFPTSGFPAAEVSVTGSASLTVDIDHQGHLAPQSGLIDVDVTVSNHSGIEHAGPVSVVVDACQNGAFCTATDNFVTSVLSVSAPWSCEPYDPASSDVYRVACTYPFGLADGESATATVRFVMSDTTLPTATCPEGLCALFKASYGTGTATSPGDPGAFDSTLAPVIGYAYRLSPGGDPVQFITEVGRAFSNVSASTPSLSPPSGVSFPYGELGFTVEGVPPGAVTMVRIRLPVPMTSYYTQVAAVWEAFAFDGLTGAQFVGDEIQLWLQDGGRGDNDGLTNGRIVDPGAPAISAIVDTDADGVGDTTDNCPFASNADQVDTGGVGNGSAPDGIGNACQCGDVSGDGFVTIADATIIRRSLLLPPTATQARPQLCDVGPAVSGCSVADATIIRRALLAPPTATIAQVCAPARP